jgi:hypothetical protein
VQPSTTNIPRLSANAVFTKRGDRPAVITGLLGVVGS